jgi:tetratricopeptide (TPR) repeat protein
LSSDPNYAQVNFFLGVSYYGLNDIPKAIQSLQQELKTAKPHPRTRFYLATLLQASGQTDDAIRQLEQSLVDNPSDADALYDLARLHKNASFQAMDRLKQLDPNSFQVHLLLGELYTDEQQYPDAIKEYQAAQQKRPNAQGIHYAIGIAYWSQHQYELAQKEFREALNENPTDGMVNLYLGDIAVRDGKFAEALPFLAIAQQSQPDLSQVHILLGKCYQAQNQLNKAKSELLIAIQADPEAAQPHYLLGQVYRKLNDRAASTSEFTKFEELSKSKSDKNLPPNGVGMGSNK